VIFCGVKLTHDAAVALVDNGRLVFSVEMEKIGNSPRYSRLDDLSSVFELLEQHGYRPDQVDHSVIDGWRKSIRTKPFYGVEIGVPIGPYRRGFLSDDLLCEYEFTAWDLRYLSYSHYASHVLGAYCSSPFAPRAEDALVLVWDGAMLPFIYLVQGKERRIRNLGCPFHLLGDAYHTVSQCFSPFDAPIEFPASLGLAGKIMAYTAYGSVRQDLIARFRDIYRRSAAAVLPQDRTLADVELGENFGRAILDGVIAEARQLDAPPEDCIASWHAFLESVLLEGVADILKGLGGAAPNFCFAGGCALNIKWNRALRGSGMFREMWVPPFPNDAGSAIGTACCAMFRREGRVSLDWSVYSGPALNDTPAEPGWNAEPCDVRALAALLHVQDTPVVVLDGRAELGPRALGNRSILAPATNPAMTRLLNEIKNREGYRPIAPICLEHRAPEVFDPGIRDPFMLYDHDVRAAWQSRIPAVCHKDGTARVQTFSPEDHPFMHELLLEYERLSGVPVLCNTSANANGCGFFPDISSAMRWGRVPHIWSNGVLYTKAGARQSEASAAEATGEASIP
jgi:carbamoyltransferase